MTPGPVSAVELISIVGRFVTGSSTTTDKVKPVSGSGDVSRTTLTFTISGSANSAAATCVVVALTGICAVHATPVKDRAYEPPSSADPASCAVVMLTPVVLLVAARSTLETLKAGYGVSDGQRLNTKLSPRVICDND